MHLKPKQLPIEAPQCHTLQEFCQLYRVGKTTAEKLIASGQLPDIKIAGRRVIPAAAAALLLDPACQAHQPAAAIWAKSKKG